GHVLAAHDISEGGLGVAIAEMTLARGLGVVLELSSLPRVGVDRDDHALFSESNGRFLVEVERSRAREFEELMSSMGCAFAKIGEVRGDGRLVVYGLRRPDEVVVDLGVSELREAWRRGLMVR
ncbi:MAG: AIR synthase-related protein, partial [Fervidicoccaceae archaeon]